MRGNEGRRVLIWLALGCVAAGALVLIAVEPGSAANLSSEAPYYTNQSSNVTTSGWFNGGDVTLDTILDMGTRVLSVVIGTGSLDQSGTGYVGYLLTALVMSASGLLAVAGAGIGAVGGTIVALSMGYGLTIAGLAPVWIKPIFLFGIGIAAAVALRRAIQ